MAEGALVIDTEAAGFFKESDRDSIEFCLREFASRLRLEMLLIALLGEVLSIVVDEDFIRRRPLA
jgi:hypothetical protein